MHPDVDHPREREGEHGQLARSLRPDERLDRPVSDAAPQRDVQHVDAHCGDGEQGEHPAEHEGLTTRAFVAP